MFDDIAIVALVVVLANAVAFREYIMYYCGGRNKNKPPIIVKQRTYHDDSHS